jgi:four helix bundle protein
LLAAKLVACALAILIAPTTTHATRNEPPATIHCFYGIPHRPRLAKLIASRGETRRFRFYDPPLWPLSYSFFFRLLPPSPGSFNRLHHRHNSSFLHAFQPPFAIARGLHYLMAKTRDLTRLLNMEATISPEKIQSHRDLIVWQKSMDLSVLIYQLSARFPSNEAYRLVSQITRSAASVAANIAEGRGRATKPDFAQFVFVAKGSLMETETFLMLALRLGYLSPDHAQPALDLITEISKMLTTLRKSLRSTNDGDLYLLPFASLLLWPMAYCLWPPAAPLHQRPRIHLKDTRQRFALNLAPVQLDGLHEPIRPECGYAGHLQPKA